MADSENLSAVLKLMLDIFVYSAISVLSGASVYFIATLYTEVSMPTSIGLAIVVSSWLGIYNGLTINSLRNSYGLGDRRE